MLALLLSLVPVGLLLAEHGAWLPDRVLGPGSKPMRLLTRYLPPVQEIEDMKPALRRFVGATTTLALEPELTSESAAALGARWIEVLHDKADAPRLERLRARYGLDEAARTDEAALAKKLTLVGHALLRDVNELFAGSDQVSWGLSFARSCLAQHFHVDPDQLVEQLQYRRLSPTVIVMTAPELTPAATLEAHLEDGHWRVHLGSFADLMKVPVAGSSAR